MAFMTMGAPEYRALDADAFAARRAAVAAELTNAESEVGLDALKAEVGIINDETERRSMAASLRVADMQAVAKGSGTVIERSAKAEPKAAAVDPFDTVEYRNAFMNYCRTGARGPELRANTTITIDGQYTQTSDVPPQVPTTMGREIVSKMEEYGDIWNRVRKLSVKGGLWFRVLDLNPVASWVGENETSPWQKFAGNEKVSFSFYQLECRVAQTLLDAAVTFDDFQALFVPAVAKAMVKALEQAIVRGAGTNGPLGFTVDPRVTGLSGHTVQMAAADVSDWVKWHTEFKAAIPRLYRGDGELIIGQGTWDKYVETLRDSQQHPVSQTGYNPVTGEEIVRLMGLRVTLVDDAIMPDFDSASVGDVFGAFINLSDYVVNTQPGMPLTTRRWVDEDNNLEKVKALMACDGKVLDPNGVVLLKKKASA